MKNLLSASLAFAVFAACANDDVIVNGVHAYTPDGYIVPREPAVLEKLEWFKDQKLGLMMHFGIYSQLGIYESWPLSDEDESWSREQVDWTDDGEFLKAQYWGMAKSFNPVRFEPEKWADVAARNGFRYVTLTTKHHDGFCMFDSKHSDFKITNTNLCPFAINPRADVVKHVFEAFRARGLGISAYFSKPDWHHPDYWDDCGLGRRVGRWPTYDPLADPARWNRFREFTKNQILELVRDYGPLDMIWLDGGQVQPRYNMDIRIEEIIAEARETTPGLIAVDRSAGGPCENVITPEKEVPPQVLDVPWESCIPMGGGFSYRYDDKFKSPRELVHLLMDVISKGGNLALNVAPGPDGRIPAPAIESLDGLGAWLRANGEAVYSTRPAAPYRAGDWAFTGRGGTVYAIRLWKESDDCDPGEIPLGDAKATVVKVRHLASGKALDFETSSGGIRIKDPFAADMYADVFALEAE